MFSTWYFLKISCAFTCYCETACGSSLMNYASSIKRAKKYMTIKISSSAIALSNSVHIQDHLNPIYHQLQSILTVRTISQPYLTIKTKKSSGSIRHCHLGQAACWAVYLCVILLSRPSVSSSVSAWLLLFLYPTALTTTSTAAAAMLADSMLIRLGSCDCRLGFC